MLRTLISKLDRLLAVKLDDSSSLIKTSRDEYKYIEGDREMLIYAELGMGDIDIAIHENSIDGWLTPYSSENIPQAKKKEILDKLCAYFQKRGITYKIVPGGKS